MSLTGVSTGRTPNLRAERSSTQAEILAAYEKHLKRVYRITAYTPARPEQLAKAIEVVEDVSQRSGVPFEICADGAMRAYLNASSKFGDGKLELARHPLGFLSHYLGQLEEGATRAAHEHRAMLQGAAELAARQQPPEVRGRLTESAPGGPEASREGPHPMSSAAASAAGINPLDVLTGKSSHRAGGRVSARESGVSPSDVEAQASHSGDEGCSTAPPVSSSGLVDSQGRPLSTTAAA